MYPSAQIKKLGCSSPPKDCNFSRVYSPIISSRDTNPSSFNYQHTLQQFYLQQQQMENSSDQSYLVVHGLVFFVCCLHTLSGPDHLAALAPLSIGRTRVESAIVGALWGCSHDAGQVIFGLLFLLLKDRLHIEVIRTWGTRVVGLTLLVIGAIGIKEASEVPMVALENSECDVSINESLNPVPTGKKKIEFATFATGIAHGLQPDALMMILPALALPSCLAGADPESCVCFLLGLFLPWGVTQFL